MLVSFDNRWHEAKPYVINSLDERNFERIDVSDETFPSRRENRGKGAQRGPVPKKPHRGVREIDSRCSLG